MLFYISLGAFAGVVVFGLLFIIMGLKGGPWKIPMIGMAVCFIAVAALGAMAFLGVGPFSDPAADESGEPSETESQGVDESEAVEPEGQDGEASEEPNGEPTQESESVETPSPEPDIRPTPAPAETMGQKNALSKAKQYLSALAFSYSGLIDQLEFEGYTTEEATYGADNCGADWNEQAAKKAQQYLDAMAFSRQGLIDQLKFDGFTQEQAEYGVTAVGY